jgi:hypothetical protein
MQTFFKTTQLNLFIKHKNKLTGLILIVFLLITVKYSFYNKTEFIVLNHLTRIDTVENRIDEIILVKNHPKSSNELKQLILDFNSKRPIEFDEIKQIFIKEHDYVLFPALTLSENFSYEDINTKSDKLDNIDFLAERLKYINWNKRVIDTIRCFVGKNNYYKK